MATETGTKKVIRPKEERIAEIDKKIAFHEAAIQKLKEQKDRINNPKVRVSEKTKLKDVLAKAKKAGMSADDIAEKLGLKKENGCE